MASKSIACMRFDCMRMSVKHREVSCLQGSSWMKMLNSYGAVWQASNMGSPPYSLRITGGTMEMLMAM